MWPKAIAQLVELLPHVARLLPMADRYFNAKSADAEASRTALEQMAAGLRGDLGQVTASHAGLYRQLNEQSERVGAIAADVRTAKASIEQIDVRLKVVEARLGVLLTVACAGLGAILVLVLVILLRR